MGQSPRRLTKPSLTLYVFYELFGLLDRQIERPTIAVIALNLHKDGQSRERILPTTATPPCPSGLTIAASPKLIWMLSAALMFGKCVISTVLVPVCGTVAINSFIFSTRCGHGGGTGAPAIGTNDSISSASDGSTRPGCRSSC